MAVLSEMGRRDQMAAAAAPYVHHRLSSTEHSGSDGGPVQVVIHTGFAYDDAASADAAVASKPKPKSLRRTRSGPSSDLKTAPAAPSVFSEAPNVAFLVGPVVHCRP